MIGDALIQEVTEDLYSAALRRVPPDTIRALPDTIRALEAARKLKTLTVGIDAHGNSICEQLERTARERLPQIMAQLAERRAAVAGGVDIGQ